MTLAELKAKATELGLTTDEVRQHGSLAKKATWETAIAATEKAIAEKSLDTKGIYQTEAYRVDKFYGTGFKIFSFANNFYIQFEEEGGDWSSHSITEAIAKANKLQAAKLGKPTDNPIGQTESDLSKDIAETVNQPTTEELPFEPTHTLIDGKWVEIENKPVSNSITASQSFPILPFTFTPTKPCKPDNSGYLIFDEKLGNWVKEKPSESSTPYRDKLIAKMSGYVDNGVTLSALEEMQKDPPDEHTAAIYLGLLEESERMLFEALAA
ncbi:hypothetical protein PCC9214_01486 [Planktothrix tepida]|uniref:Uncharacterized protein n=1 Tax=Planktothrix tepida PCC 9214 TaxID=671072 RepID=A0A1J1LH15_9CYAN|nr:hypothetical protein [Planktothrix tepida]CAD5934124.1 hypothetical protein PCC9214_01486 [Planktothrix tepida]CUR31768.1 hypothetical protein PL9214291361 [Planktothrix tepida PCC 9214]